VSLTSSGCRACGGCYTLLQRMWCVTGTHTHKGCPSLVCLLQACIPLLCPFAAAQLHGDQLHASLGASAALTASCAHCGVPFPSSTRPFAFAAAATGGAQPAAAGAAARRGHLPALQRPGRGHGAEHHQVQRARPAQLPAPAQRDVRGGRPLHRRLQPAHRADLPVSQPP
jgi:hypothetical protein